MKTYRNKLTGKVVSLGDFAPVPAGYELATNAKPCSNCSLDTVKTVKQEITEVNGHLEAVADDADIKDTALDEEEFVPDGETKKSTKKSKGGS
jgi:hypothetical protein